MSAHFLGDVKTIWLRDPDDDRNMELIEDFVFVDQSNKQWKSAKGSIINGASIPPAFWTVIGPPFVGNYRRASVVHDTACKEMTEPSDEVHLMFFDAMIADGTGTIKAHAMYQAVKQFGPSWDVNNPVAFTAAAEPTEKQARSLLEAVANATKEAGENATPQEVEKLTKFTR